MPVFQPDVTANYLAAVRGPLPSELALERSTLQDVAGVKAAMLELVRGAYGDSDVPQEPGSSRVRQR